MHHCLLLSSFSLSPTRTRALAKERNKMKRESRSAYFFSRRKQQKPPTRDGDESHRLKTRFVLNVLVITGPSHPPQDGIIRSLCASFVSSSPFRRAAQSARFRRFRVFGFLVLLFPREEIKKREIRKRSRARETKTGSVLGILSTQSSPTRGESSDEFIPHF